MGINISVYRIKGVVTEADSYPTQEYKYFDKEEHPTWDWVRHSGDRDFWMNESFEWETRQEGDSGDDYEGAYYRPKDLNKAIEWVKENITPEGNTKRVVDILEEMKSDPQLYFRCSY